MPPLVRGVVRQQALGDREVGHRSGRDVAHDLGVGVDLVHEHGVAGAEGAEQQAGRLEQIHTCVLPHA